MTKMASYEEHEAKENMAIGRYFRSDYIAIQVLKAVISVTIAFAVIFAIFLFYDFEKYMQDIYEMDILSFAKNILKYYIVAVVVYAGICYGVCTYRYIKARKSLKLYYQNLKKLDKMYTE